MCCLLQNVFSSLLQNVSPDARIHTLGLQNVFSWTIECVLLDYRMCALDARIHTHRGGTPDTGGENTLCCLCLYVYIAFYTTSTLLYITHSINSLWRHRYARGLQNALHNVFAYYRMCSLMTECVLCIPFPWCCRRLYAHIYMCMQVCECSCTSIRKYVRVCACVL